MRNGRECENNDVWELMCLSSYLRALSPPPSRRLERLSVGKLNIHVAVYVLEDVIEDRALNLAFALATAASHSE